MSNSTVCHPNICHNCYQSLQLGPNARMHSIFPIFFFSLPSIPSDFNAINVNTFLVPQALGHRMFVCVCVFEIHCIHWYIRSYASQPNIRPIIYLYFHYCLSSKAIFSILVFIFRGKTYRKKKSLRYPIVDWCLKEKHELFVTKCWKGRVFPYIKNWRNKICWLGVFLFAPTTTK